jgi:glyoxylase-like metal-dependent hydrolase (beta-lactamase superfamily II)
VVIAPPDGDMAAYLDSLEQLRTMRPPLRGIAPGHGHLIDDPAAALAELVEHRLDRERQVLEAIDHQGGKAAAEAIVEEIYVGLIDELVPRARQSVHAHLRKLDDDGVLRSTDRDDEASIWTRR